MKLEAAILNSSMILHERMLWHLKCQNKMTRKIVNKCTKWQLRNEGSRTACVLNNKKMNSIQKYSFFDFFWMQNWKTLCSLYWILSTCLRMHQFRSNHHFVFALRFVRYHGVVAVHTKHMLSQSGIWNWIRFFGNNVEQLKYSLVSFHVASTA